MGITPVQAVDIVASGGIVPPTNTMPSHLVDELWLLSEAGQYHLTRGEFELVLLTIGTSQNFGQPSTTAPTKQQQETFFRSLKLNDLALAQACARGVEVAWVRFVELYQPTLIRAAVAISGSETLGRELAESLYAELYGLTVRNGERRCPLDSYQGRGSLLGWLRTTLAQRHVDYHRRRYRERPLDDAIDVPSTLEHSSPATPAVLVNLPRALRSVLQESTAEVRFLLISYYLDAQTLHQIAQVLGLHEATVSRRLYKAKRDLRKQLLRKLESLGLKQRAAEEALGTDPRDLDINLRKLLQVMETETFPEKSGQ